MNIFNKFFLVISLALAIPLSTQAYWFSDLRNQAQQFSNLANAMLDTNKMAASAYTAFKFLDKITLLIPPLAKAATTPNKTKIIFCALGKIYQAHKQHWFNKSGQ